MQLDHIDIRILQLLAENSRMQWKDLGERIHMTGQAVGNRIKKLEDHGIIKSYSVILDEWKLGFAYTAFVIIYMKTANHDSFIRFMNEHDEIVEAHRISGEGCYHLKIKVKTQDELNSCLDGMLEYGNYGVNLSIKEVKTRRLRLPNLNLDQNKTET
ncbi:HTH-type transcriptional regulator LrpC [compost metagenome]